MTSVNSLTSLCLAGGMAAICCQANAKNNIDKSRPNIIIIHMDDMGYGDISITGAQGYNTPNIDRMFAHGLLFTNFYSAQSLSSASRAGLLTGCYPERTGVVGALDPRDTIGLRSGQETIATMLKKNGYATAIVGKWHVGQIPRYHPNKYGFDYYFGLPYSNDMWPLHPTGTYDPLKLYENEKVIIADVQPEDQKQLTTSYTKKSVEFIKKNRKTPFFLYLAHSMPHVPLYVSEKFEGASSQGRYGDVMMEVDWSVGEIMNTLEKEGLSQNTLVIFTSDNGPWLNYGNHAGSSGGLREGKCTSMEGGQRVPCLIYWPGKVAEGEVKNSLVSSIDLLPTIAQATSSKLPESKIDGISFLDYMTGKKADSDREYFCYYFKYNLEGIRNDKFKLVFEHRGRTYAEDAPGKDGKPGKVRSRVYEKALYDLRRDPGERINVLDEYPEVVAELEKAADKMRKDLGDKLR